MTLRILLADDHKILRDGLRKLLESKEGFQVVAVAANGHDALSLTKKHRPDLVILDIAMPILNGIDATRRMVAEVPGVKVVILSMHNAPQFVRAALDAGARAYLLKECSFEELIEAIDSVASGHHYLSKQVTGLVIEDYLQCRASALSSPRDPLTPKEREVLQRIAEGQRTKDIAASLHVSPKTIETHRSHIMEKLRLRSVAALTKYAIREGLTSMEH